MIKTDYVQSDQGIINESHIRGGMSYEEYRGLIEQLLLGGKTTGENQSQGMIGYTRLNVQRMNRLDDKISLNESLLMSLRRLHKNWYWVVLTEAWCGDAAQNIPILAKIAEATPRIVMKLLLRDEVPEIMDHYLTNGSKSIPKLICLSQEDLTEVGTWGPRPEPVQKMILNYKENPKDTQEEFIQNIHTWYNSDKGHTLQDEIENLISKWNDN